LHLYDEFIILAIRYYLFRLALKPITSTPYLSIAALTLSIQNYHFPILLLRYRVGKV
jgi:hypothetical protein